MAKLISKSLSVVIALSYLVAAASEFGAKIAICVAIYLVIPLLCIWFSEEMGQYTGALRGQMLTAKSPGCLVAFAGWLLLLLPVIAWALLSFHDFGT